MTINIFSLHNLEAGLLLRCLGPSLSKGLTLQGHSGASHSSFSSQVCHRRTRSIHKTFFFCLFNITVKRTCRFKICRSYKNLARKGVVLADTFRKYPNLCQNIRCDLNRLVTDQKSQHYRTGWTSRDFSNSPQQVTRYCRICLR